MAQPVSLLNKSTNEVKKSATGFSWTMVFWGPFPPLFRSDWKWAAIVLGVNLVSNAILPGAVFITGIVFGVTYNKSKNLNLKCYITDCFLTCSTLATPLKELSLF